MDIKEIRRLRLRKLVLTRFSGKQSAFADAIGRSASYVARLFSDNPAHSRNVGESLAREIETICQVPRGFLDKPLTQMEILGAYDPTTNPPSIAKEKVEADAPPRLAGIPQTHGDDYEHVSLTVLDVPEWLGFGAQLKEVEAVGRQLTLDAAWLRRTLSIDRKSVV